MQITWRMSVCQALAVSL